MARIILKITQIQIQSQEEFRKSGLDSCTGQTCGQIWGLMSLPQKEDRTFLRFTQKHQTKHVPQRIGHKATRPLAKRKGKGPGGGGGMSMQC